MVAWVAGDLTVLGLSGRTIRHTPCDWFASSLSDSIWVGPFYMIIGNFEF
jgi:hypothetical protein